MRPQMELRQYLNNKIISLLFILMSAFSCRHKEGAMVVPSSLGTLDEKNTVISETGTHLTFMNDSDVIIINGGKMVLYNIYTGIEKSSFSPDTSYNTCLISYLNNHSLAKGNMISIKSELEKNKQSYQIPTASIHTCFKIGDIIYAPYYLLTPYYKNIEVKGKTTKARILDHHLLMFILDRSMKPIKTIFGTDTIRYCFNFGFHLIGDTLYASNLTTSSQPRLPVFSKYRVANNEIIFSGSSAIEFSKNAYHGQQATFVNTSFAEDPATKKILFCDTRRIAEVETEKVLFDNIFSDLDTAQRIMQFRFSSRDPNDLYFIIDSIDSSWSHNYAVAHYSLSAKKIISRYELGTNEQIKAFSFHGDNVITLEVKGEKLLFRKYEVVQ